MAKEVLQADGQRLTRRRIAEAMAELDQQIQHHDYDARAPAIFDNTASDQVDANKPINGHNSDQLAGNPDYNDQDEFPPPDDNDVDDLVGDENPEAGNVDMVVPDPVQMMADGGPSTRGRDEFVSFCNTNHFFAPFTSSEEKGVRLLDVLRQKKAPLNAYSSVMEWHLRETGAITDQQTLRDAGKSNFIGRNTLVERLAKRYNLCAKGPTEKVVRLPYSKEVVRIPVFDAEDCLVQLVTNPKLEDKDFDFFDDDPLAGPPNDLDYVGNINTGTGYRATYDALVGGPNEQLLGTVCYIDAAVTGQFSDLPVNAVKISLTIFTREARQKEHTWATLGYIPTIRVAEGRGKKAFKDSGHLEAEDIEIFDGEGSDLDEDANDSDLEDEVLEVKAQDYHFMLRIIFESLRKLQETGWVWDLSYKGRVYPNIHYHLYIPIIRCDTEEADKLAGKYLPRTRNIKQLCRQCHVPTMEADDHRRTYPDKTQTHIEKLVRKNKLDQLQQMSQHYLRNAFYNLRFNQLNDRGIHGACPSEMLHAMLLGVFKYCRDIFFTYMGDSAAIAHEVNGLARIYGKLLSHQSDRSLPSTNFSKGIRDGKLMAKDYRGVLLIMAAVLRSSTGRKMLGTKRKFRHDYAKDDWLLLVETLLEWEAFLCQPTMKLKHVKRLDKKHSYIMYIMKKVAKRSKGMGLNIIKFHAIRHMMEDILVHGVPMEADTGANESHHKTAKVAARLTQRNESSFQYQVAERMYQFKIIDLALFEIEQNIRITDYFSSFTDQNTTALSDTEPQPTNTNKGENIVTDDAKIRVFVDPDSGEPAFDMVSRSQSADKTMLNLDLLDFLLGLQSAILTHSAGYCLPIRTRHRRMGTIFHGHPNYRGHGPWKDWVFIDWGEYGKLPCHIHCFVELDGLPSSARQVEYGGIKLKDGVYGVVESAELEEDDEELKRSDLFIPYLKSVAGVDNNGEITGRTFYLADTEAFVGPCAVVPDIGGPPNRYLYVKPRTEWNKEFIKWVERPHVDDETDEEDDD